MTVDTPKDSENKEAILKRRVAVLEEENGLLRAALAGAGLDPDAVLVTRKDLTSKVLMLTQAAPFEAKLSGAVKKLFTELKEKQVVEKMPHHFPAEIRGEFRQKIEELTDLADDKEMAEWLLVYFFLLSAYNEASVPPEGDEFRNTMNECINTIIEQVSVMKGELLPEEQAVIDEMLVYFNTLKRGGPEEQYQANQMEHGMSYSYESRLSQLVPQCATFEYKGLRFIVLPTASTDGPSMSAAAVLDTHPRTVVLEKNIFGGLRVLQEKCGSFSGDLSVERVRTALREHVFAPVEDPSEGRGVLPEAMAVQVINALHRREKDEALALVEWMEEQKSVLQLEVTAEFVESQVVIEDLPTVDRELVNNPQALARAFDEHQVTPEFAMRKGTCNRFHWDGQTCSLFVVCQPAIETPRKRFLDALQKAKILYYEGSCTPELQRILVQRGFLQKEAE